MWYPNEILMKRGLTLLLLLISGQLTSEGQVISTIDSLNHLSEKIRKEKPDSAFLLAQQALKLSRENGLTDREFNSLNTLCHTCYYNQRFEESVKYCGEVIEFANIEENRKVPAFIHHGLSNVHLGLYNDAISSFLTYSEIGLRNNDMALYAGGLANLGLAYLNDGNLMKAAEYFRAFLRVQRNFSKADMNGYAYQNYARVMMALGKNDSAKYYFDLALQIADIQNNTNITYWVYAYKAELPDISLSEKINLKEKALSMAYKQNLPYEIMDMHFGLAQLLLKKKDFENSVFHSTKVINQREGIKNYKQVLESYKLLAQAMVYLGRYEESRDHLSKYEMLKDSLANNDVASYESIMGAYELTTQEREVEQIKDKLLVSQAVNKQIKIVVVAAIIFILLIGWILMITVKASRAKSKNNRNLRLLNEKLDAAIKEKDTLTGMIVHDIRSPFNKIEALMQLFQMDEEVSPNQKEIMDTMLGVVEDSRVLTNDLLEVNKLEAGKLEAEREKVEIRELIDGLLLPILNSARNKQIDLISTYNLEAEVIPISKMHLQRIIENLVSNAIKYTPVGGKVELVISSSAEIMTIIVRDNGPGIPKDEQALLFRKFGRASTKPTGDESSTGLGLYIVDRMCALLSGKVSLNSEKGQGAEFIVKIPVVEE